MIKLPMSDDTLKENAALLKKLGVNQVTYREKRERVLKHSEASDDHDSMLEAEYDGYLSWCSIPHILHPFTFILPGRVKYTPDFIAWVVDDLPRIYEVKGDKRQKNARDSYTRFRLAAGIHRWARFFWVEKHDGQWIEEEFRP